MKGNFSLKIEETDETRSFPLTSSWEFKQDSTMESIEDYIDLFNQILAVKGFRGTLEDYIGGEDD